MVTANAYLRARPIADGAGSRRGGGRDGPGDRCRPGGRAGAARFGWSAGDLDAIAGAVVAGHVIECGAQCCGGNYAFFEDVPGRERIGFPSPRSPPTAIGDHQAPRDRRHGDGGHGDGAAALRDRRAAVPESRRRGAFDTIELREDGPDRVRISGVHGEPPPPTLKVTANLDAAGATR